MEKESFGLGERVDQHDIQERTRRATRQFLRWLPWAMLNLVVVGASIVVGSIGFFATAVTLTIFSPILVPASVLLFVIVASGLAVVAVCLACYGLYKHIKNSSAPEQRTTQEHPPKRHPEAVLAASSA